MSINSPFHPSVLVFSVPTAQREHAGTATGSRLVTRFPGSVATYLRNRGMVGSPCSGIFTVEWNALNIAFTVMLDVPATFRPELWRAERLLLVQARQHGGLDPDVAPHADWRKFRSVFSYYGERHPDLLEQVHLGSLWCPGPLPVTAQR